MLRFPKIIDDAQQAFYARVAQDIAVPVPLPLPRAEQEPFGDYTDALIAGFADEFADESADDESAYVGADQPMASNGQQNGEQDHLAYVAAVAVKRAKERVAFARDVQNAGRFARLKMDDTLRIEMEQVIHSIFASERATAIDLDMLISAALALRSITDK